MISCPKCGHDSLPGSMFCEKCGYNISGVKVRPNPDYLPHGGREEEQRQVSSKPAQQSDFSTRPTPAQRPMPVGMSPAPAPRPVPAGSAPASADYGSAVTAALTPSMMPAPAPAPPVPGRPAISAEEAALRSSAYGALEAKGGQPVFYIARESVTIGRSIDNDIALEAVSGGQSVSRSHARLLRQSEGVFVEDLNSSNGTFVNGKRLLPEVQTQIFDNDEIRFGAAQFIVHLRRKG